MVIPPIPNDLIPIIADVSKTAAHGLPPSIPDVPPGPIGLIFTTAKAVYLVSYIIKGEVPWIWINIHMNNDYLGFGLSLRNLPKPPKIFALFYIIFFISLIFLSCISIFNFFK
ncbi:MAG: hypothetical protein I3273_00305 [Candidatus Moeniiplasma glomeromycotorum]|nr:hypothetical protein [Candidatus Moeniiplasma glomeromycotorum]MCE8167429.1 hypothetical protein [Candidatus Moeniiplasma glomeromycotorum]MCE8168557.1 hypothetical protein [Candidatus Moeniiplasma glomeromycotorum]